jgi:2,4-dienoyl-CoA reductase-like NADH-dependent reductase (Old Yellow Enzyme family)
VARSVAELSTRFATGEFDLVAIGRSLIGDPDLVEKIKAGRYGEIRAFRRADIASLDWKRTPGSG